MFRKKLLKLLFPPLCGGCNREGNFFCRKCTKEIISYEGSVKKYVESGLLNEVIIGFSYTGPIKETIKLIKYKSALTYVFPLTKKLLLHGFSNTLQRENTIITSIPMHRRKKYMVRGYNQAELLGKELSNQLEIPYKKIAIKKKITKAQARLSRKKRKLNTVGVFSLISDISEKTTKIIIVDDIITTGSTLYSFSNEIKKKYPNIEVMALIFAKN